MNVPAKRPATPWYRHPWPWILMAGPFAVIIAGAVTVYLAVVSNDGLVEDDYYKQGLAVNQTSARAHQSGKLGVQADAMQSADGRQLRLFLRAAAGTVLPPTLRLRITHPTRAGVDQDVALRGDGTGAYSGALKAPLSGRWHIALEDEKREWRLTGDWIVEQSPVLHLLAEKVAEEPAGKPAGG